MWDSPPSEHDQLRELVVRMNEVRHLVKAVLDGEKQYYDTYDDPAILLFARDVMDKLGG